MDQNIIILVLILIAILVAFYATYLSMDNSRKIRRLQNDIRDTLGNINSTLKQEPNLSEHATQPIPKVESRTNLQDLDQFPSLEEIENYDNQKMMAPIDADLKKELDAILDDSIPGEEVTQGNDNSGNLEGKQVEQAVAEQVEEQAEEQQVEEEEEEEVEVANENTPEVEGKVVDSTLEPETLLSEEVEEIVNPENDVATGELNMEAVSLEEASPENSDETNEAPVIVETELIPDIEPISLSEANLLKEIDALFPENRLQNKSDDTESVVESVIGEDEKKKRMDSLPSLEELTEEILQKMHDKNVKLICKRETIKVRGTKVERIQRILEAKEFKINVN